MKKKEMLIIISILLVVFFWYLTIILKSHDSHKNSNALVYHNETLILEIDMGIDAEYEVDGDLGIVTIEVLENKIRVKEETSPLNYCSIQGWVSRSNVPIICLPNKIMIIIENDQTNEDDIVTENKPPQNLKEFVF